MIGEKIERSNSLRFIIIVLLILVLASIVFVGYFLLGGKDRADILKSTTTAGDEYTLSLDEFIVNLKSEKSMRHYLKIEMALMYRDERQEKTLSSNVSKIRDVIIKQLRSKTPEEVLDIEKMPELKKEIVGDINAAIQANIVQDIYFTDLVIQ